MSKQWGHDNKRAGYAAAYGNRAVRLPYLSRESLESDPKYEYQTGAVRSNREPKKLHNRDRARSAWLSVPSMSAVQYGAVRNAVASETFFLGGLVTNIYMWRVNVIQPEWSDEKVQRMFSRYMLEYRIDLLELYKRYGSRSNQCSQQMFHRHFNPSELPSDELARFARHVADHGKWIQRLRNGDQLEGILWEVNRAKNGTYYLQMRETSACLQFFKLACSCGDAMAGWDPLLLEFFCETPTPSHKQAAFKMCMFVLNVYHYII